MSSTPCLMGGGAKEETDGEAAAEKFDGVEAGWDGAGYEEGGGGEGGGIDARPNWVIAGPFIEVLD